MKALFTHNLGEENFDKIRALGYEVVEMRENEAVYNEDIADVEVLLCYHPFDTLDISKMKNLKWIQLFSAGVNQVPADVVLNNNITLTNNRGGYSIPMGEWIVLKTLELYKKSAELYSYQKEKKWHMNSRLLELYGRTITFIGTGSIAKEGAKRFQGFGTTVIGINTKGNETEYFNKCYPIDQLDEVLTYSDVVVLTLPYTEQTHHLINKERLEKMKKDAAIINVSRGSIINEEHLIAHLKQGNLLGAALDVFETEPLSVESPLWEMDNVIVTAHNSWMSEMRDQRRFYTAFENMRRYAKGEELMNVINLKRGY